MSATRSPDATVHMTPEARKALPRELSYYVSNPSWLAPILFLAFLSTGLLEAPPAVAGPKDGLSEEEREQALKDVKYDCVGDGEERVCTPIESAAFDWPTHRPHIYRLDEDFSAESATRFASKFADRELWYRREGGIDEHGKVIRSTGGVQSAKINQRETTNPLLEAAAPRLPLRSHHMAQLHRGCPRKNEYAVGMHLSRDVSSRCRYPCDMNAGIPSALQVAS